MTRGILRSSQEKTAPLYRDSSTDTLGISSPQVPPKVTFSQNPSITYSTCATPSSASSTKSVKYSINGDSDENKLWQNGAVLKNLNEFEEKSIIVGQTRLDEDIYSKASLLTPTDIIQAGKEKIRV